MRLAALTDIAELNPRLTKSIDRSDLVSFVPMSAVSAETGSTANVSLRPYADVAKGYTAMRDGDLLFAKITPCFENGKIGHAVLPTLVGFGSTEFHVVRVKSGAADARYLLHFLRQGWIRVEGERRMTGSGGQRRVPASFLEEMSVPLPSLPEQRRIAEILDRAETLRAQRKAALAQLDALAESIFLDMFGDPVTNPRCFETVPLASLVREDDSINYGVVQPGDDVNDGVPLIRVGDLGDGRVSHRKLKRIATSVEAKYTRSRLRGDEILVSCVGTVGVVAVADPSVRGFNIARAVARIPLCDFVDRAFVVEFMKSARVQRYFVNELRTVSQPTLNIKQLSETIVLLPPLEMQRAFAQRIATLDALRVAQQAAANQLDSLFTSLQHRSFRGNL